jgi:translation initiation factor IF-2
MDNNTFQKIPIVAVMGHVDHGKTSLLDAIRGTNVQSSEVGGITQNTRAHQITFKDKKITFIDTPGHEAFSEMRSRGAKVTDIVMIVVAADDGVQPQTKESIKFALQQKVPVIVAVNKIDLPGTNINKLKQQLATAGLQLEGFGGDIMVAEVSALQKIGLDELLDSILLLAEMSELKATGLKDADASGFVLESKVDKSLGPVTLLLVKSGVVSKGSYVVSENGVEKIRDILDEQTKKLEVAYEGEPIWLVGLGSTMKTGETIKICKNEKDAKVLKKEIEKGNAVLNDDADDESETNILSDIDMLADLLSGVEKEENIKYLNVVIKTDSRGTLEVVESQLNNIILSDENVKVKILDSGIGDITEKDINTAKVAHGIVIGFQINIPKQVQDIAKKEKVLLRNYEIIYELIEEIEDVLISLADPIEEEIEISRAKVKKIFVLSNGQKVAGSEVIKGLVIRGYRVYVERDGERVGTGRISLLKKLKNEVKEVKKGEDCGIMIDPNIDIEEGDEIVCYKIEKTTI